MRTFYKLMARMLIVCMVWTPFSLQAGMIGTDQVVAGAVGQASRDKVVEFVSRGDVARQLEAFGLSASSAKERVSAMTQEEVNRLSGKIDSMPAGADGGWLVALALIGVIVWLIYTKR